MQGLDPAQDRGQGFIGDADQIVQRLLRDERATGGVDSKLKLHGTLIPSPVFILLLDTGFNPSNTYRQVIFLY